jgi:multidrug efflux pump subunit AcrB
MTEQQLFDAGQNFIRPSLASVPGATVPSPYGGRVRQVQIDLDPAALQSKGLSADDVAEALAAQNQIIPPGTAKIGDFEYDVKLNNSPEEIAALNDLPIKTVNGATIYMRDVGHVRDGFPPQQNEVRVNGRRSVLMTLLKSGSASTLAIIEGVKAALPRIEAALPSSLHIDLLNDQSLFVKAAISGVVREGLIAAALTSLMILLFLGSWRSTVIIATSIPLAVLSSIIALSAAGQTLNIMTLGGLALAVGILVDDATVTIENINWHLEQGKDVRSAILDGAAQIVTPAFVSLTCICIVFVPMFQLQGVSGFLFVPMAEAVIFAMIASFILSRTLVPMMALYILRPHQAGHAQFALESHGHGVVARRSANPLARLQHAFERRFSQIREGYRGLLALALRRRRAFVAGFLGFVLASLLLTPLLGSNFFPQVDSGEMTLHVRAPVGTRIEDTAALFDRIEAVIRGAVPPAELGSIVDNIGLSVSGINTAYSNTGAIGPMDGDIYVTLNERRHPTAGYVRDLRARLPRLFPGVTFAFLPADIISQILNFGAPAPIDVQVAGPNREAGEAYALDLERRLAKIPGLADVRLQQSSHYPELRVDVDRTLADKTGVTERDVTNSLVTTLAGSFQTAPTFWLNPRTGVSYPIVIQTPQQDVDSLSKLANIPISSAKPGAGQILGGLGTIRRDNADAVVSHYDIQPSFDVYAAAQGRDLGSLSAAIQKVLKDTQAELPKGSTVTLRGQVATMNAAFSGLGFGLVGAIVLIYLMIVVNFQNLIDPFVIITALPAALAGIVWMLFATGTTLSVPALTGAIMCMGVATANSILVVSFARERFEVTGDAVVAALEAGFTRFRPVLMTALAMIIGMAPMALGLGEGGEQNAPLGRAVIGGLVFATCATLLFVPVVFSFAHARTTPTPAHDPERDTGPGPEPAHA